MQAINFLSRVIQDLENHGLSTDISLLKDIDVECANFYKSIHHHIIKTKEGYDDYRVIKLPILKRSTFTSSTKISDWMRNVAYTLDEETTGSRQYCTLRSQLILVNFYFVLSQFQIKRDHFSLAFTTYVQFCTQIVALYF